MHLFTIVSSNQGIAFRDDCDITAVLDGYGGPHSKLWAAEALPRW